MATDPLTVGEDTLGRALGYMESALELLDAAGISAHIGAHLDLAICELRNEIGTAGPAANDHSPVSRPS